MTYPPPPTTKLPPNRRSHLRNLMIERVGMMLQLMCEQAFLFITQPASEHMPVLNRDRVEVIVDELLWNLENDYNAPKETPGEGTPAEAPPVPAKSRVRKLPAAPSPEER